MVGKRVLGGLAAAALAISTVTAVSVTPTLAQVSGTDALHSRVRTELATFTNWLRDNGVQGYVGEVGWPNNADTAQWNALAQAWYQDAAAAGLWVSQWSTGEWWGTTYKLSSYVWDAQGGSLAVPRSPASVIEAQAAERRSVNMNGADFGPLGTGVSLTSSLSNANPGVYDRDWHYDNQQSFTYLASRGIRTVRLAFRWERIQPVLGAPLDPTELGRLVAAVGRARSAGLNVILNPQNYGAYWLFNGVQGVRQAIGSAAVPLTHFSDLWRRLSQQFATDPGVIGYGLMNEPVGMAAAGGYTASQVWEQASQAALDAIRANGDVKLVMVPGYQWAGVTQFPVQHPRAWITDPAANFRYEAHQYFDRDSSGAYLNSYAAEVADAQARGYSGSAPPTTTTPPPTPTTIAPATTTTVTPATTTTTMPTTTTTTVKPAGTDIVAPSVPTNLYANGARRKVILSWGASTDTGGSGLASYEVFRATSAVGPYTLLARTTSAGYQDVAVTSRVPYWYVVRAVDRSWNYSGLSNTVTATPN